jgi:D-alanyl-D-alanine dipeptidase
MKPYQWVPIQECGEPLVPIPTDHFSVVSPHPYQKLGAPYGGTSPFFVRQGVLERLVLAQGHVQAAHPGWGLLLFDAYRPLSVQQFMVDYTLAEILQEQGISLETLSEAQHQQWLARVYEFWAEPDYDPAKPPPHSTGGALDLTLVDASGEAVDMGSPIDELSPRSYPDHYAHSPDPLEQGFHRHRAVLNEAMTRAGFRQHPGEWWHFCYGDQMWAWLGNQVDPEFPAIARYGRVE